jgi:hypothetical protein
MAKRTREELRRALGLPEDQPGVVNVLVYRGTVYGVYERYDDAYEAGIKHFGESAMSFLDAHISRQRVE